MSIQEIDALIRKYGLKPATQRKLPLLTVSGIAYGYTTFLHDAFGFNARAVGGLGSHGHAHFLLNETAIGEEARQKIKDTGDAWEERIVGPVTSVFTEWKQEYDRITPLVEESPEEFMRAIVRLYPRYYACIGVYNALWRGIGDGTAMRLSSEQLKRIGDGRDRVAKIYPCIEEQIKTAAAQIGAVNEFDGDSLRYRTYHEFAMSPSLIPDVRETTVLKQRREKYFYLYVADEDREFVVSDPKEVAAMEQRYFTVDGSVREVQGSPAFGGVVRGTVLNLLARKDAPTMLAPNTVLVASMTHPNDITLIKQAAAIVTDEGGILCHAAIISRELKIPTVIGTKVGTKVFKTGESVEVNAENGVVKKL